MLVMMMLKEEEKRDEVQKREVKYRVASWLKGTNGELIRCSFLTESVTEIWKNLERTVCYKP